MTLDQQFNIINDKLQQLLKQQGRLKKENERLKEELQKCKETENSYQQLIDELSQQISILKLSGGDMNDKDKREFEKKINQYIREIDKCIAFLGQ
jgi:translation initiation factor 2B subunit (eIF-2B alpha/beta/delta family)